MWWVILFGATWAAGLPVWTAVGSDPGRDPLRRDGDRFVLHAEPWFGRVAAPLIAIPFMVLAIALTSITFMIVTFVIGAAASIVSRLEHRNTITTLDEETIEVVSPWLTRTLTTRLALRDIASVDLIHHRASSEQGTHDYVQRSLRLVLTNGTRHRVALPMDDGSGDAFADKLRERIAAAVARPESSALETLVVALATPGASSLYRGDHQRTTIDPDRHGIVRENGEHRLALHLERDGLVTVATLRSNDQVTTRRFATVPSVDDLERWIATESPAGSALA
jgi:hypothetical protein